MKRKTTTTYTANVESKSLLEVLGLVDDEQIERETPAEVGHDNGVHGHGGEEGLPRRADPHLGCEGARLANGLLDVDALLFADRGMNGRSLVREEPPRHEPEHAHHAVEVERRLPADALGHDAREGQTEHGARIRAGEADGGEATALHGRGPVAPDAVTGRVGDALDEALQNAHEHGHHDADLGGGGQQAVERRRDRQRYAEHAIGGELGGEVAAGHLCHQVAPEERAVQGGYCAWTPIELSRL